MSWEILYGEKKNVNMTIKTGIKDTNQTNMKFSETIIIKPKIVTYWHVARHSFISVPWSVQTGSRDPSQIQILPRLGCDLASGLYGGWYGGLLFCGRYGCWDLPLKLSCLHGHLPSHCLYFHLFKLIYQYINNRMKTTLMSLLYMSEIVNGTFQYVKHSIIK
jgi:hypothetical protein